MKKPTYKQAMVYSGLIHFLIISFFFIQIIIFSPPNYVTQSSVMKATLMEVPKQTSTAMKKNKEVTLPKETPFVKEMKSESVKTSVAEKIDKPVVEEKKAMPEKAIKIPDKKNKPIKPIVKNEMHEEVKPTKKIEKTEKAEKIQQAEKKSPVTKTQKMMEEKLWAEQLANEEKQLTTVKEQQSQGVINKYNALILSAIRDHWILAQEYPSTMFCQLLINLKSDGTVVSVQLTKSSGDEGFDRSARAAVYKASPLPVPKEADIFDQLKVINLIVRP